MRVIEYGENNLQVIMLLHGGGLSWWNYREAAAQLNGYHVVLPVLDGHADSDVPFTSIEDNANELIDYIDKHFDGSILAIGGLSLGGQILVEMLSQRDCICQYAIIESALTIPMPVTNALIAPMLDMSYELIRKKWFARMQFDTLKIKSNLFEDYYRDTCKITKQDMICFMRSNSAFCIKPGLSNTKAKTLVIAGSKEQSIMTRSAELLHEAIPNSKLRILNGYSHGDLSINHPKEYAGMLNDLIVSQV